jgi:tripartite-type tricarboxylate transporter receptor subunit TctC
MKRTDRGGRGNAVPKIRRRAALLAAPALLAAAVAARAQDLPARQLRFVVGFAAGGANDIMARLIAAKLNERVAGTTFIVENRPGAATLLAADHVARAAPDGTTFMYTSVSTLISSLVNRNATLDVPRDLAPVILAQSAPLLMVVRADHPARSLGQLLAMAKERPGRITVSHPGHGGINHLDMVRLSRETGAEFTLVPYTGNAPSLTALLRGEVEVASDSTFTARAPIEAGQMRAIAVSSAKRLAVLPDVPTYAETVPGHVVTFWGGIYAPRGTPEPILDRLNREVDAVLRLPDVIERLRTLGSEPEGGDRARAARFTAEEWARWGQVVREAGVRAE